MKPMKVMRGAGSYRLKQQRKKRIQLIAVSIAAAVLVIVLAVVIISKLAAAPAQPAPDGALPVIQADVVLSNGEVAKVSLKAGQLRQLSVTENVDLRGVAFESDNPDVALVDPSGCVMAVGEGTAHVSATAFGFKSDCEVTVSAAEPAEESAELTTAITANSDVLDKNKQSGSDDLYNLVVNRRTNVVTAYTYDNNGEYNVPVRAMVCSCGTGGEDITPVGDYAIYFREAWHPLFGEVFGMYVSGFEGTYLFHSVPYYSENHDDLETEEFNKLGTNASMGCVRMMASDVRWIYKNCPLNTPVSVIDSDSSADPLGKPETVKIDESIGWDPTDPNKDNPYKGKLPVLIGVKDLTVKKGESFDYMSGIKAEDICGNDITDRVAVVGSVLTDKPGTYFVSYTVSDSFRLTSTEITTITVTE